MCLCHNSIEQQHFVVHRIVADELIHTHCACFSSTFSAPFIYVLISSTRSLILIIFIFFRFSSLTLVSRTMCNENSVHYWETPYAQPFFDNTTKRDITATVGQPALLHCRVRNLGDRAVSERRQHLQYIYSY